MYRRKLIRSILVLGLTVTMVVPAWSQDRRRLTVVIVDYLSIDGVKKPEYAFEAIRSRVDNLSTRAQAQAQSQTKICTADQPYFKLNYDQRKYKSNILNDHHLRKVWNEGHILAVVGGNFVEDKRRVDRFEADSWIYIGRPGDLQIGTHQGPKIEVKAYFAEPNQHDESSVLAGYALLLELQDRACPGTVRAFASVLSDVIKKVRARGGDDKLLVPMQRRIGEIAKANDRRLSPPT